MAQWLRQFTGNTHLSKVRDRETQLRHAVEVYRTCDSPSARAAQSPNVLRIAHRLLKARIKAKEAQIAALDPRKIEQREPLERKLRQMLDEGVRSILDEFSAPDIVDDCPEDEVP